MNEQLIIRPIFFDKPIRIWPSKSEPNPYESLDDAISKIMGDYYSTKIYDDVIVSISCDSHEETIFCKLEGDMISYWDTGSWDWYEGEKEVHINWLCPLMAVSNVMEIYKIYKEAGK